jgi:hypothetical protein
VTVTSDDVEPAYAAYVLDENWSVDGMLLLMVKTEVLGAPRVEPPVG